MKNGFLLGELLYRHNQLQTFGKFIRSDTADAKINNWCLIEPVLRSMSIKFDAQLANAIMQGKPGAASAVLYKVRTAMMTALSLAPPPLTTLCTTHAHTHLTHILGENVPGPAHQLHDVGVVV